MELDQSCWNSNKTKKRKLPEEDNEVFGISLDDLNQDVLERVLSWLPTSSFIRFRSVCKRWKSVEASPSFLLACSEIPTRDPWFFMVDPHLDQSVVFDTAEKSWKCLKYPLLLQENPNCNSIPVAASGGLVCFRNMNGDFVVSNPVTGSCRELPPLGPITHSQTLHAIAMNSHSKTSYKLVLIFGELPHLTAKIYESVKDCWTEEIVISRKSDETLESDIAGDDTLYFLSKAGDVVTTNMQRSPSKQYSSVITVKEGVEIINFLSSSGTIVACNLVRKCFLEYPRLLPVFLEYSIDVVECRGELLVVVLSEFLETASLRVWRFSEDDRSWTQVAAMPPSMSHECYSKKADINCVGSGDQILICINSGEFCSYVLFDLVANRWTELPKYYLNGKPKEFMSAFSFEPRIEACV
ncbi:F-box only protein [Thalictrum thalictroides]|uniref:F-box only protein n=1 Tax=Thalictrum thalictroides TaxID=46969 RepID=A0A7J6VT64_THATH|nr:F-box only protein [Thalictrum thalictroides]